MKRFKAFLGVFAIFFFGVIFGVAITAGGIQEEVRKLVEGGPDKVVDSIVNRLKKQLNLDHSQEEMLHQIAVQTQIKLSKIRQRTQPEVAQTLDSAAQDVRGILNPDQIKKFDEIVARMRARWKMDQAPDAAPQVEAKAPPASTPPATPSL